MQIVTMGVIVSQGMEIWKVQNPGSGKKAILQDPFQGGYSTFCAAEIDIAS